MIIYADDICLYIHSPSDLITLQRDVDTLVALVDDLALTLNVGKCKSITFSRKQNPTHSNIYIHGLPLQHVSSLNYLGFLLSQDLSWSCILIIFVPGLVRSLALSVGGGFTDLVLIVTLS